MKLGDLRFTPLAVLREVLLEVIQLVAIKRADLASRAVTLASLEIERVALGATRAANGDIDLLRLLAPPPAASAGPAAAGGSRSSRCSRSWPC